MVCVFLTFEQIIPIQLVPGRNQLKWRIKIKEVMQQIMCTNDARGCSSCCRDRIFRAWLRRRTHFPRRAEAIPANYYGVR